MNLQHFSSNVLLITDTATGSGSMHEGPDICHFSTPRLVSGLQGLELSGCCGRFPEVKADYSHEPSAVDRTPL